MADIRTYLISPEFFDIGISVTLAVDCEILTEERAEEINAFWSGAKDRLDMIDDAESPARAVVIRLAAQFLLGKILADSILSTAGLRNAFANEEGWGDYAYNGIRVVDWEQNICIYWDELEVTEIEATDG